MQTESQMTVKTNETVSVDHALGASFDIVNGVQNAAKMINEIIVTANERPTEKDILDIKRLAAEIAANIESVRQFMDMVKL